MHISCCASYFNWFCYPLILVSTSCFSRRNCHKYWIFMHAFDWEYDWCVHNQWQGQRRCTWWDPCVSTKSRHLLTKSIHGWRRGWIKRASDETGHLRRWCKLFIDSSLISVINCFCKDPSIRVVLFYDLEDPHEGHFRVTEAFLCKYLNYYYYHMHIDWYTRCYRLQWSYSLYFQNNVEGDLDEKSGFGLVISGTSLVCEL